MILMIDNYDSFTYNIVQYLGELGANVKVVRNDMISIDDITKMNPEKIVISPGPCTPNEAGISIETINKFSGEIPILGICLGHQSIGQAFGGKIIQAKEIMHGKTSKIIHQNDNIFSEINNPFIATRYHSLVIEKKSIPDCLEIIAWTKDEEDEIDEIMAVKHKEKKVYGVQFHPESIASEFGHKLLDNFLNI
ncbi:MAG: glutamine amidotransferase [Thiotrichaceae bacterium]|jgi:anthranilate synthase component 2|nr:MAG: glutamine amidotransferase [Thiotrichaceae bacterium]|tara:strand:- start:275 stop:853 length:579 start_codon:yes stop_codon:yes gene_type:complete